MEGVVKSVGTKSQVSREKNWLLPLLQHLFICPAPLCQSSLIWVAPGWKPNPSIHWLTWKTLSDSIKPPSNCLLGLSSKQISTCTEVMKQKFSSNKWRKPRYACSSQILSIRQSQPTFNYRYWDGNDVWMNLITSSSVRSFVATSLRQTQVARNPQNLAWSRISSKPSIDYDKLHQQGFTPSSTVLVFLQAPLPNAPCQMLKISYHMPLSYLAPPKLSLSIPLNQLTIGNGIDHRPDVSSKFASLLFDAQTSVWSGKI